MKRYLSSLDCASLKKKKKVAVSLKCWDANVGVKVQEFSLAWLCPHVFSGPSVEDFEGGVHQGENN